MAAATWRALGEMLAGFMNCNAGGRDHTATYVERQVIDWSKEIFGFPATSSGILTTGTSMATLIALAVAANAHADADVRKLGVAAARPLSPTRRLRRTLGDQSLRLAGARHRRVAAGSG